MDSDQGKLFIGGISWETTEEKLGDYFKAYGDVAETVIMKDRTTGRARGFGFVVFSDPAAADRVLLEKHTIDGRTVETKKAVPRDEQQNVARSNMGGPGPAGQFRTKKIFVGGLAPTVTEEDFRKYFEQFGTITDVVVMYDHNTQRTRGFGFITFDSEDAVEQVLQKPFHELNEKMVEVKRAVPKELSQSSGRGTGAGSFGAGSGRGTGYGGAYGQSFNSSPGGGGYGARPGGGRGGYPYATPGYGAGGYANSAGYAAGMNGGYGGASYGAAAPYGNATGGAYAGGYGMAPAVPGYGTAAGYGGAASGGYNSTQAGGRSGWGGAGSGYGAGSGSAAYGTTAGGYGNTEAWGTGAAAAQPAGASGGYSASAYAYAGGDSGYGSNGASYGSKSNSGAGYANSGAGGGNYPSGYGEMYGGSGYNDGSWKPADPYNSAGVGSGGSGGGGYGLGPGVSAEVAVNGPSDFGGSYGAAGKQTPRGPDARFRPYPATADRSS